MADMVNEMRSMSCASYPEIFERFRKMADKYGDMPVERLVSVFTRTNGYNHDHVSPEIQNRRVKAISSLPVDYTKDQVAEMLRNAPMNEKPLRQVSHTLQYTAYPYFHIIATYQNLMTYHNYVVPQFLDREEAASKEFKREFRMIEKLRRTLNPKQWAHQIAGQALLEGKVFYTPRISVDKPHNKVNYAFLQQLPSDYVKIVGFNNRTKYTVAFNLFYFMQPGTSPEQFGDLFTPYLDTFREVTKPKKTRRGGKNVAYASVDMNRVRALKNNAEAGTPDVYYQGGKWYYWVTLPVNSVFTFEIDDINREVVPPLAGLFLNMIQLANYEQIQLQIVQNPLVSLLTGEIPYVDSKDITTSDQYKLSNAGRALFEAYWYQMLSENNTDGIGFFAAPLANMKLHQLSEAPSAMEIATNGYAYTMEKAGLSAVIPTTDDPKAGLAQISMSVESRFAQCIYTGFENMMNVIIEDLNPNYEWRFRMFGTLAEDAEREKNLRNDMTLGILPATAEYMAMRDMSILDDIAVSSAIAESGVMDMRMPLVSSYSASQGDSGLPPQAKHDLNPGGRPDAEGKATSEGQEDNLDSLGG
jgi:hypothetical protein